jgi:hypothetical protein
MYINFMMSERKKTKFQLSCEFGFSLLFEDLPMTVNMRWGTMENLPEVYPFSPLTPLARSPIPEQACCFTPVDRVVLLKHQRLLCSYKTERFLDWP